MPKLVFIDPGHGGHDPGASGNGLVEKELTLKLGLLVVDLLVNNFEVNIALTREKDSYVGLDERANLANNAGADLFVSLHNNAFNGSARGFESFVYVNLTADSPTFKIQDIIHEYLAAFYDKFDIPDRGKKQANFAVVRETEMSAILLENLFIDNKQDAEFLKAHLNDLALAITEAIAKAMNLPEKENSETLYRVQVGAFRYKDNAERLLKKLERDGYDGFIVEVEDYFES